MRKVSVPTLLNQNAMTNLLNDCTDEDYMLNKLGQFNSALIVLPSALAKRRVLL